MCRERAIDVMFISVLMRVKTGAVHAGGASGQR